MFQKTSFRINSFRFWMSYRRFFQLSFTYNMICTYIWSVSVQIGLYQRNWPVCGVSLFWSSVFGKYELERAILFVLTWECTAECEWNSYGQIVCKCTDYWIYLPLPLVSQSLSTLHSKAIVVVMKWEYLREKKMGDITIGS